MFVFSVSLTGTCARTPAFFFFFLLLLKENNRESLFSNVACQ